MNFKNQHCELYIQQKGNKFKFIISIEQIQCELFFIKVIKTSGGNRLLLNEVKESKLTPLLKRQSIWRKILISDIFRKFKEHLGEFKSIDEVNYSTIYDCVILEYKVHISKLNYKIKKVRKKIGN